MEKRIASMIHVNRNGSDAIKIEAKDEIVFQSIKDSLKDLPLLRSIDGKTSIFITKYTILELFEIVLKTKDIANWQISGGLIDQMKPLMPKSQVPCDWVMGDIIKNTGLKIKPYQIIGANSIAKSPGKFFILNDEDGIDRIYQTFIGARHIQRTQNYGKIVILCSKYALENWKNRSSVMGEDFDFEIYPIEKMKSIVKGDILIVDDIHLSLGAAKRKRLVTKSIDISKKAIVITNMDFNENIKMFGTLLKTLKFKIPTKAIEELSFKGVDDLVRSVSGITSAYIRRTKADLGIISSDSLIEIPMEDKFSKMVSDKVMKLDFDLKGLDELIEICSILKVPEVLRYISNVRRAHLDAKIVILSRFPMVLRELGEKISESKPGMTDGPNPLFALINLSEPTSEIEGDLILLLDPFLDSTKNLSLSSHIVSGLIVKMMFKGGPDSMAFKYSRYASVKRNFNEILRKMREIKE